MTRETMCAHVLQPEYETAFACYLHTSNVRQAWFIGLRHALNLGGTVKRPVGKCIVPVTLLHGTSVANLHFFIERLKLRFIEPVIQTFYRSLCCGVV